VYDDLTRLSARPAAIVETGVVDDPDHQKATWIRDTFAALRSARYPRISGVVWWHMLSGEIDTRIDSSPESLEAFRAAVADPHFGAQPRFTGRCMPAAPRGVAASRGAYTRYVRVTWRAVPNAATYEIWRAGTRIGTTETTRYDDRRAQPGRVYAYSIRAVNLLGKSTPSARAAGFRR
jgi:hypothetical protein